MELHNLKLHLTILSFVLSFLVKPEMLFSETNVSANASGELITKSTPAPSLKDNLFGIPAEQPIAIYLPPSYSSSDKKFPVVYYLPGFGDPIHYYTYWAVYQGFSLKKSMDRLINEGKIKEMMVVIPNGLTFLQGTFYVNSPISGNWEDFIAKDLVNYVDQNFRTISSASSRGISGHSMGGFGALNLSMLHPDVFGAVYALSPGLFAPDGLAKHLMFADQNTIEKYLARKQGFEAIPEDEAKVKFMSFMNYLMNANDYNTIFAYAYGAAFAPNTGTKVPYIDYPYSKSGEKRALDTLIWKRYENGFGNLAEKVKRYKNNFLRIKAMTIDYGVFDEYEWIREGCEFFSRILDENVIPHQLLKYEGDHSNKLRERIELYMLPFFSNMLVFE